MNEKFKQRLVGLIVVLALLFGLSWLLPRQTGDGDRDVPSTVVPLGTVPVGRSSRVGSGESGGSGNADELGDAEGAPQIPPEERVPPREWGKRRISNTGQTPPSTPEAIGFGADKSAPPPAIDLEKPHTPAVAEPKLIPPPAITKSDKSVQPPVVTANPDRLQPFPAMPAIAPGKASSPPLSPKLATTTSNPPVSPPSVSPSSASSPDVKSWYVQIGSFADPNNAQTTLSLLQNIGYHGESIPITGAGGNRLYRVRLGPFANEAAARASQDKIARQGYPQSRTVAENSNGR